MNDQALLEVLYRELESNPRDALTLSALADWYEEHGEADKADCLRWTARRNKRPHRYDPRAMKVTHTAWHKGWYWWARTGDGYHWGHPVSCRLPATVWRPLRHGFKYNPRVFKEYHTLRQAYEALFAVWPPPDKLRS
jgi:hypothetical protein